jgi:hypothetical protein
MYLFNNKKNNVIKSITIIEDKITGYTADRGIRNWFLRSDKENAGPTIWQSYKMVKGENKILREKNRIKPPTLYINPRWKITEPILLTSSIKDIKDIYEFWNNNFKSKKWYSQYEIDNVRDIISTENEPIVLGIRTPEGDLCATIISILIKGITNNFDTKEVNFRVIKNFVIDPTIIDRGIGSWLFGWMDYYCSVDKPSILSWNWVIDKKEIPSRIIIPIIKFNIISLTYTDIKTSTYPMSYEIPYTSVQNIFSELQGTDDFIFSFYPSKNPKNIKWYRAENELFKNCATLIGIAETNQRITINKLKIYQVVFACLVRVRPKNINDIYNPFWEDENSQYIREGEDFIREGIEIVTYNHKLDIVYVTDSYTTGNYIDKWKKPWKIEKNKLGMYLYNYNNKIYNNINIMFPYADFIY